MSDSQEVEHEVCCEKDDEICSESRDDSVIDSDSESDDEYSNRRRRNRRKPKYTKESAMNAILSSRTQAGHVLRSIGHAEGAPRAGRSTVDELWKLVNQTRPQSEIKRVMEVAAQIAAGSGKRTISPDHITKANAIILGIKNS